MVRTRDTHDQASLKAAALENLWMHSTDWTQMAEEGGPTIVVSGQGVRVTDSEGKTWLDVHGGYASVNVGYGQSEIAETMLAQMRNLTYFPQGTTTEPLIRLVEKLGSMLPGDLERVWPVSGGSEANETAIKIARAFHKKRGEPGRYKIISRKGSYHGATAGVMWLGGGAGLSDYEPAPPGMVYAPQPNPSRCELGGTTPSECASLCAQAIEDLILFHGPKTVAALIAEPITSAGGAIVPGDEYWPMVRDICDRTGVLLIADEVVCGFGRTGKMFASEHWDLVPDLMTIGKGLTSSYLPMAATIATTRVADVFAGQDNIFRQALTFGGHPVTAAVALKNIEIIERDGLVENSAKVGEYFLSRLHELKERHEAVRDVRGKGLLLGIDMTADAKSNGQADQHSGLGKRLTSKLRDQGLLLKCGDNAISMGPPLCITREDVDEIVKGLDIAFGEI
ncbi:MAG: aspartate aminotransferase family protein [Chloroflexi bacterium]|nr:aspartate aminotransferase family protein [Chloroflexota bacterium]MCI0795516.1 aspartate aminotransferase family protein [Chloroflexota bacterium]MCI0812874.1 aspartate aminotransferase family protein [Chloroflexota bacterium]MCI0822278.1 aspartate aminotransferase family protein [Chloroflexota bacterium]MCI0840968.1 aspartate aminotransferase family protein [Chloroflexota bacterium]